jgi:dihydroorotase-like cyclic amidohydrolase
MSENPARLIGQFPKKGAILPGTDADITIVDMNREIEITDEALYTKPGWTPYLGWKVKGTPVLTMVRGTVVARDGKVIGEPGHGKYLAGVRQQAAEPLMRSMSPGLALEPVATAS